MTAEPQHRIARVLSMPENLTSLRRLVETSIGSTLKDLASNVCAEFGFRDALGRLQVNTCATALRKLGRQGRITLPKSGRRSGWRRRPRGDGIAPPMPENVPSESGGILGLKLELVHDEKGRRQWNELLLREHPQGGQIITGRQLRYMIRSEHGLLGAIGVSASALHLEARDRWIGWDWDLRGKYLNRVICLSRFLLRPGLDCQNLASRVLGLFCRSVSADMERAHGFRPWLLETFLDTSVAGHNGVSYRAANWTRVGETKGRGRHDLANAAPLTKKDIYVYCLEPDFRRQMGLPSGAGASVLSFGEGLDGEHWAENELGGAPLGDGRLARRLVSIAATKSANPGEPFLMCAKGRSADMQGYYRFIEHPDESAVSMKAILQPHAARTINRMRGERRVLCPQDSSDLDYTSLKMCAGLGQTGKNQHGAKSYGLRLHTTMALTTTGLPLGILQGECLAREFRPHEARKERKKLSIEEKESHRWLRSVQECQRVAAKIPGTKIVCLMDREGDIFDLFNEWRKSGGVELLVRAAQDRACAGGGTLFAKARAAAKCGQVEIVIPRRKDRNSQPVSPEVTLTVRRTPVKIGIPKNRPKAGLEPVDVWMVHAVEENPPPDTDVVEWFLISTESVEDFKKASQCLSEYACRWRIEDWHKVLKSGCAIEEVIAEDAKTLERIITINMVIAWRILLMVLLGRECPGLPPQTLFSDIEIRVLAAYAAKNKYKAPDTLGLAVILTSMLGGYRNRNGDPPPGTIVLWRGYVWLHGMSEGAALMLGIDSS